MRIAFAGVIGVAIACFGVEARAAGATVDQASKEQLRAAEKTFHVADDLYDAKRYEEALTAYRASFDIVASPNSRLMIARSLIELGRLSEAYVSLESAIESADSAAKKDKKYASTGRAAREELATLKTKVALVSLDVGEVPRGTELSVGGTVIDVGTLSRPLVLAPGTVKVVLIAPDGREARRELELQAGSSTSVRVALPQGEGEAPLPPAEIPPEEPKKSELSAETPKTAPSSLRVWAYVAGGVGVAGLATFGIFGAMSQSKFDSLEADCPDGHCPPDRGSDIDAGQRFQTIANVGLAVGIVGVGTGVTLFLLSSGSKERASRTPWVALGPGRFECGGRF